MLEGLTSVNWERIKPAFGSGQDLPDVIRSLASDNRQVYEVALEELLERINHQDTIYDATRYVVPFLIELLSYPGVRCKAELLYRLNHIVRGCGGYGSYSSWFPRLIERDILTHRAVSKGEKIYIDLLQDSDAIIRVMTLRLLSSIGDFNSKRVPFKVAALIKDEHNSVVKAMALLSLGQIISKSSRPVFDYKGHKKLYDWILRRFYSADDLLFRQMAIFALVYVSQGRKDLQNIPLEGLRLIFTGSDEIAQNNNRNGDEAKVWYFLKDNDDFLTADGYAYKGIFDLVNKVGFHASDEIPLLSDMLNIAFVNGSYDATTVLTRQQRILLQAIVNSEYFWMPRTPKHALSKFELPDLRDELRKLASR